MHDDDQQVADSQVEPEHDSGLQTPQPDQPIPTEPVQPDEAAEQPQVESEPEPSPEQANDQAAAEELHAEREQTHEQRAQDPVESVDPPAGDDSSGDSSDEG